MTTILKIATLDVDLVDGMKLRSRISDTAQLFVPYAANNTIFILAGTEMGFTCKVKGTIKQLTLKE